MKFMLSEAIMAQLRRYNRYQDVEIDASLLPHDEIGKFLSALSGEESKWLSRLGYRFSEPRMRGNALFWVKIRVQLSHLLPHLLGGGVFTVHHATPEYIMLVKGPGVGGLPEGTPLYGTHYARVECIVLDIVAGAETKLLLVKEMIGNTECNKKLVTGSVESGECISQAAEREVMEETGISAEFLGVIGIVNRLCTRFGRDEILVGCLLRASPSGQIPKPMSSEIKTVEWGQLSELTGPSGNYMAQKWGAALCALMSKNIVNGLTPKKIPDFRGHGQVMTLYSAD